jgi:putative DNA methylase
VVTYLAFLLDKLADLGNALNRWEPNAECPRQLFARQAIPMVWDYAEGNPFSNSSGSWNVLIDNLNRSFNSTTFDFTRLKNGFSTIKDISNVKNGNNELVIITDPPYYDNIGYADLSDFFYVWLRRSLKQFYPDIFKTLLVPKTQELVATPYRFEGDKKKAERFFETGMKKAFRIMHENHDAEFPLTLYYAFKQSEKKDDGGIASTGWETMLQGLIDSGFQVLGTWPIRTEMSSRMVGQGTNVLASSIILVCRKRAEDAPVTTRGKFIGELHKELSSAVKTMQESNIPPVDLQQSAIGPGMAIYSKYSEIREASGTMRVHDALVLINQHLDEILGEAESDYDDYTRWAVSWFEQYGNKEGEYGTAENLAKAKVVSVKGMVDAGFLFAQGGKVRLLRREELASRWSPQADTTFTIWEATQHLVYALIHEGENKAAELFTGLTPDRVEAVKQLCYRLYNTCENKKWSQEAQGYNALIASFPSISEKARAISNNPKQGMLL